MRAPPSCLGGSQVRKIPLDVGFLHLTFSGGSGTAIEKNESIWSLRNQFKEDFFLHLILKKINKTSERENQQQCETVNLLAGADISTGSSIYAGSPGPHLLYAETLNRYSFPWMRSGTVNSWSSK